MTAHELARELLAGPDLPVHAVYNYGDYWKTEIAERVREVTMGYVEYSAYHRMDKVMEMNSEEEEQKNKHNQVILLS